MSNTRQRSHELIDRLPPAQLIAIAGLLEAMLDPVPHVNDAVPLDDEPLTVEDQRRLREGKAWFAGRDPKGNSMEEVLAGFCLKPDDFPVSTEDAG